MTLENVEIEKRNAAEKGANLVEDGMSVGLGSGSTAALMIEIIAQRIRQGLRIRAVPTSQHSEQLARQLAIPLFTLDDLPQLDITIDGADEVDDQLDLIKGGGGALLREKVAASVSDRLVIIVDSSKRVSQLGAFPLPVEVAPFAWRPVQERISTWNANVQLRLESQGRRFITDEGNYILDCSFSRIADPRNLAANLNALPGVMEHGLFIDMADQVIVGRADGVDVLHRSES